MKIERATQADELAPRQPVLLEQLGDDTGGAVDMTDPFSLGDGELAEAFDTSIIATEGLLALCRTAQTHAIASVSILHAVVG